jgi:hypothetical protein
MTLECTDFALIQAYLSRRWMSHLILGVPHVGAGGAATGSFTSRPSPGQPPDGKLDGGDGNEGSQGLGEVFEVLGRATISAEP